LEPILFPNDAIIFFNVLNNHRLNKDFILFSQSRAALLIFLLQILFLRFLTLFVFLGILLLL
jgi:hypothetical protein